MINIIHVAGKQLKIAGVTPMKLFASLHSLAASATSTGDIGSSRTGIIGESLTSMSSVLPPVSGLVLEVYSEFLVRWGYRRGSINTSVPTYRLPYLLRVIFLTNNRTNSSFMRQFVRLFDRLFARFFLVLYFFLASLSEKNCVVHQRRSQDLCFYPNIL